jgi:cobalt-zinc-cadmium efflux system outer membrane protein
MDKRWMQQKRHFSTFKTPLILGLTLGFGTVFFSSGHAQSQQMVSPQNSSGGEIQSFSQAKSFKNANTLEPKTFLQLADVLNAAKANFDVGIARSQTQSAQGDLLAADHAPLPVLSARASQMDAQNGMGAGSILRDKRIDKSLGIDWTWERGDKRTLRAQTAKNLLSAAQFDLSDTLIGQQIMAYAAFIDLYAAQLKEDEFFAIAEGYQKTNETASIRLKNGDLSAQEAFRISIENQRAQADAQAAKLERQTAALMLSQLVKLKDAPLSWRVQAGFTALASTKTNPFSLEDAFAQVEKAALMRPDVMAAMQREKAANAAFDLALSLKKTDLTWGASIDHYPGTSNRLVELRVQLPLQVNYSYEGEIKRAQEQLRQAQLMTEKTKLLATTELQSLLQNVLTAKDRSDRYEEIILPQAKKVLEQAEFAYNKGALTLTDLLDARRTFRATRIESIALLAELTKSQGSWYLRTEPYAIEQLVPSN